MFHAHVGAFSDQIFESGPIGPFSYHICTSRKLNHAQLASRILRTNRISKMMTYMIRKASDRTTLKARKEERVVRTRRIECAVSREDSKQAFRSLRP
jgi:hypothetical protein